MKLKFDINGVPPTTEDINTEIVRQRRRMKLYILCSFPLSFLFYYMLITVLILFWMIGGLLFAGAHSLNDLYILLDQAKGKTPLVIPIFIAIITSILSFYENKRIFKQGERQLSTIDPLSCEKALKLSKQYSQINAYRMAVIKQRLLTNEDLAAMERFVTDQSMLEAKAKLEQKYQTAFDELHNVDE